MCLQNWMYAEGCGDHRNYYSSDAMRTRFVQCYQFIEKLAKHWFGCGLAKEIFRICALNSCNVKLLFACFNLLPRLVTGQINEFSKSSNNYVSSRSYLILCKVEIKFASVCHGYCFHMQWSVVPNMYVWINSFLSKWGPNRELVRTPWILHTSINSVQNIIDPTQ